MKVFHEDIANQFSFLIQDYATITEGKEGKDRMHSEVDILVQRHRELKKYFEDSIQDVKVLPE